MQPAAIGDFERCALQRVSIHDGTGSVTGVWSDALIFAVLHTSFFFPIQCQKVLGGADRRTPGTAGGPCSIGYDEH